MLDEFAFHFQGLPGFRAAKRVVFVEGQSEKALLDGLIAQRFFTSDIDRVEMYGGKGNATAARLPLEHLAGRGLRVTVQVDGDGSETRSHRELSTHVATRDGDFFRFKRDFESAIPVDVLWTALKSIGIEVEREWLKTRVQDRQGAIAKQIEQKSGKKLGKVALAGAVATIVARHWKRIRDAEPTNESVVLLEHLRRDKKLRTNDAPVPSGSDVPPLAESCRSGRSRA